MVISIFSSSRRFNDVDNCVVNFLRFFRETTVSEKLTLSVTRTYSVGSEMF